MEWQNGRRYTLPPKNWGKVAVPIKDLVTSKNNCGAASFDCSVKFWGEVYLELVGASVWGKPKVILRNPNISLFETVNNPDLPLEIESPQSPPTPKIRYIRR